MSRKHSGTEPAQPTDGAAIRRPGSHRLSRRRLLGAGALAGASLPVLHQLVPHQGVHAALDGDSGALAAAGGGTHGAHGESRVPPHARFSGDDVDHAANGFDPTDLLRDFDYGTTRRLPGGRRLREWEIVATDKEIEVAPGVSYEAWTFNGRVPGPTLRCTEGERLRIRFTNASPHAHTMHFHGLHSPFMDGVPGVGEAGGGGQIEPGESFDYEFDAEPFGLHLYHCHTAPLAAHIAKGLYGAYIVDPKGGRPEADELAMVMNGFDTDFDGENEVYAVNSVGFHYLRHPVRVRRGELVRIYLVNVLEFDLVNSFHLHANFFQHYPTGTSLEPSELTDTVVQGQGQRGILELRFPRRGRFMFHAHVSEFAELGWMGFFEVV
jgi:FtsP/CotA-like multicopper oxidase with cupredoxin domain